MLTDFPVCDTLSAGGEGMKVLGYIGGGVSFIGLLYGIFFTWGLTVCVIGLIIMLVVYWFTFDEI